ncbi:MAG: hypothetical protein SFU98_21420 [Leptospiraceae bacterium]|nr:hypothetical protein [Leptospiraceae bacterium]
MKSIICIFLFLVGCSNSYYGVPGPNVVSRNEAVAILNRALALKVAACGLNNTNSALLVRNFNSNQNQVLDGAYYAKKDIKFCENSILFGTCLSALIPCNISPKGFFDGGGLFQGGF